MRFWSWARFGNFGVGKAVWIPGLFVAIAYFALVILGILAIAALIYSLT